MSEVTSTSTQRRFSPSADTKEDKWDEERNYLQNTIDQLEEELRLLKNGTAPKICTPKRQLQFSPQPSPQKTTFNSPQKLFNRIRDLKEEQKELKDSANAERLNLEKELSAQKKKYESLIKDLTQAKNSLMNEKKQSDKNLEKLKNRVLALEEFEKKTLLLTSELNREKYERNKLQSELEEIKKRKNDVITQNTKLKDQIKDLKKLDEKKDSKMDTPQKKILFQKERYDNLIAKLTEEKDILSRHKTHAEELINNLNMRLSQLEGYEKAADKLSAALQNEQLEKQKLKFDLNSLLEKKQELESLTIRLKDELRQLADLMERRNKLDSQSWSEKDILLKQLILEKDKCDAVNRELKTLRESVKIEKDLTVQIQEMNAKKDRLSSSFSYASPKRKDFIQQTEKENMDPEYSPAKKDSELSELKQKIYDFEHREIQLSKKIENYTKIIAEFNQSVEKFEDQIMDLKCENKQQTELLHVEREMFQKNMQNLNYELEKSLEKLKEREVAIFKLQEDVRQMKKESNDILEKEKIKSQNVEDECKTLQEKIKKLEADADKLKRESEILKTKNIQLEADMKMKEDEFSKCLKEKDQNWESKCENLRRDILNLETELKKLKDGNGKKTPQKELCSNLTEKLNRLRDEYDILKENLEKSEKEKCENKTELLNLLQVAEKRVAEFKEKIECQEEEINHLLEQINQTKPCDKFGRDMDDILKELDMLTAENVKLKLENSTTAALELQINRLEIQLEKSREQSILNRELANNVKKELASKEKELSDLKIDNRILQRELNDEAQVQKRLKDEKSKLMERLVTEKEKLNCALSEEKELRNKAQEEIAELKEQILVQQTKHELQMNNQNEQIENLNSCIKNVGSLELEMKNQKIKIHELERQLKIFNDKEKNLLAKISSFKEQIKSYKHEKTILENQIGEWKQKCTDLEKMVHNLQETSLLLDEQVVRSEEYIKKLAWELKMEKEEKDLIRESLNSVQTELHSSNKIVNEEKSLRAFAENNNRELIETMKHLEDNARTLQEEILLKDDHLESALLKLSIETDRSKMLEDDLEKYKDQINLMEKEADLLKVERTKFLTRLHEVGEENEKLRAELADATNDLNILQSDIGQLQYTVRQLEMYHAERHLKSNTTLEQHTKLIDLLQTKMLEASKKKHTFTDFLFKSKSKENLDPKDLDNLLQMERKKSKSLAEQLYQVQAELMLLRGDQITAKLMSPASRSLYNNSGKEYNKNSNSGDIVLADIANSPNMLEKHILARIKHNIPHRFELKLCTKADLKCAECKDCIKSLVRFSQCSECRLSAHTSCCSKLPPTCCLPDGYFEQFANLNKQSSCSSSKQLVDANCHIEGWMKVLWSNKNWEQLYAKIVDEEFVLYDSITTSANIVEPVLNLNLKSGGIKISEKIDVFAPYLNHVTKSELPLLIAIECDVLQRPVYLKTKSLEEKVNWLNVLNSMVDNNCDPIEETSSVGGYYNNVTVCVYNNNDACTMNINCITQLSSKVCAVGAENGLFSIKMPPTEECRTSQHNSSLVPIFSNGAKNVQRIKLLPKIRIAVVICDMQRSGMVMKCDLRQILSSCEAAECSEPHLSLEPAIEENFNNNCYMLANSSCHTGLAVATKNNVICLFEWNPNNQLFCIKRRIDAKDVLAMVFTPINLLYSTIHGFYRFDFQQLISEELKLKTNDRSAANIPRDILKISDNEYLVCTEFHGYYVDRNGKRFNVEPVKWSQKPKNIVYNNPFIYTIGDSSISVIYMNNCGVDNTVRREYKQYDFDIDNPLFLGISKHIQGGIFVEIVNKKSLTDDDDSCHTKNIILIDGLHLIKQNPKISWSSVSIQSTNMSEDRITAELNISSTDVSINSSVLHSSSSESENGNNTQYERKVKFSEVDETINRSSLTSLCNEID